MRMPFDNQRMNGPNPTKNIPPLMPPRMNGPMNGPSSHGKGIPRMNGPGPGGDMQRFPRMFGDKSPRMDGGLNMLKRPGM